jgi:cyclopropane fatty-acyl-phospholipid synthase-like methyltransferase
MSWYREWFNQDYLHLYAHRSAEEAEAHLEKILSHLQLPEGATILDLGCGAGRYSIPLARRGYQVTGLDLSPTLLAEARKSDAPITWIEQDMRDLSGLGPFDLVLSLFTSFGYFNHKENQRVLEQVYDVLKADGRFVLDYLRPEEVKRKLIPHRQQMVEGEQVDIECSIEDDRVIKRIKFPDRMYEESVALYTLEELTSQLAIAGLQVTESWHEGDRQLLVAAK